MHLNVDTSWFIHIATRQINLQFPKPLRSPYRHPPRIADPKITFR